ncbi:hypothetical protein BDV93DRAFT_520408 [Ceratobasidium sp. AG-I]|nr:hypothetical protein BDV93DRAFT_520408 [Ceratobasidium sp. AG-I]
MSFLTGTCIIHSVCADIVIDLVSRYKIEGHSSHQRINQQWYVQRSSRGYAIKSAQGNLFLGTNNAGRGSKLEIVCEHDASIWNIEHQHDQNYMISIVNTQMYITLPPGRDDPGTHITLAEAKTQRQLWWIEKISDESGGIHQPQNTTPFYSQPSSTPGSTGANTIVSDDPNSPYADDAHFHTDMLFNMPRNKFTRLQRAAVLDWARTMGAPNVPTLESLDECERRFKAEHGGFPDGNNSTHNMRSE